MNKLLLCATLLSGLLSFSQNNEAPHYELVGDWHGNNYTVIYPLGWSKKGDFAYIFQDVNGMGGAWIYTFDLYIQHPQESEPFFHKEFVYDLEVDTTYHKYEEILFDAGDSTYYITGWMKFVLWPEHKLEINKILKEHGIIRSDKKVLQNISEFEKENIKFESKVVSDTSTWRVDKQLDLFYEYKGEEVNFYTLENKVDEYGMAMFHGYEVDLLYYNVEGFIKNPVTNDYFIYIHECTMGFEEAAEFLLLISMSVKN